MTDLPDFHFRANNGNPGQHREAANQLHNPDGGPPKCAIKAIDHIENYWQTLPPAEGDRVIEVAHKIEQDRQ